MQNGIPKTKPPFPRILDQARIMIEQLIGFIKLVRVKNLLFIALTQYLAKYFIINTVFKASGWTNISIPELSHLEFFLLVLSTLFVTAAGNIINDYFDVKIDAINKPAKVVIGKTVSRRVAMTVHFVFNIIGVALGFYLGWTLGNYQLGYVHLVAAGLLWFYSTNYKKQLVIGNVIVSILTMLTIMLVGFFEPKLYTESMHHRQLDAAAICIRILLVYSFFAFMVSMIREVVKDLEDSKGDASADCKTIPIVFGVKQAKIIVIILMAITMVALTFFLVKLIQFSYWSQFVYLTIGVLLPLLYGIWLVWRAETQANYHKISNLVKLIMLMGILSMLFFYYIFLEV